MTPVSTFFRTLEAKCCASCGKVMTEQAESYATECFECQEKATMDAYKHYYKKNA